MRGELALHLLSSEAEEDGRAIIDSFIVRMEGMLAGTQAASFAFGVPSLRRYLKAQLLKLRQELRHLEEFGHGR